MEHRHSHRRHVSDAIGGGEEHASGRPPRSAVNDPPELSTGAQPASRRQARLAAGRAALELLSERWPKVFRSWPQPPVPLKIGIRNDIAAALGESVTPVALTAALNRWCRSLAYLKAIAQVGAVRVDLQGQPAGSVTPEEAALARNERMAKFGARNATEKQLKQGPAAASAASIDNQTKPTSATEKKPAPTVSKVVVEVKRRRGVRPPEITKARRV